MTEPAEPRLIQGGCLEVLPTLPADHFHCAVTSPPYFALRSYLPADHPLKAREIGSEPTPEEFIATMVRVFREVRRVLHPSGLLFLNLGDCYGSSGKESETGFVGLHTWRGDGQRRTAGPKTSGSKGRAPSGGVPGQLLNMSHRVAEALRADGWIWRQTIVWAKKSPMPESVRGWRWERCRVKVEGERVPGTFRDGSPYVNHAADGEDNATALRGDGSTAQWSPCPGCPKCEPHGGYVLRKGKGRCTTAHEFIFVMSKSPVYFWDSAAFVEQGTPESTARYARGRSDNHKWANGGPGNQTCAQTLEHMIGRTSRNPRSVWHLSSEPTSVAHFATFPSELVRRCIQAGTSDGGCCPECGEPWAPVVESERVPTRPGRNTKYKTKSAQKESLGNIPGRKDGNVNADPTRHCTDTRILGYRPTCDHGLSSTPCRVLDPFAGIGTTLQTAQWMKRESVGIELNPEYVAHAEQLIDEPPRWWKRKHQVKPKRKDAVGQRRLF
jgi:DNA modification methylase